MTSKNYRLIIVLLLLNLYMHTQAQIKYVGGSAKILTGKVHTICCFVSTKHQAWAEADKQTVLNQIKEADDWLIEKAQDKGITNLSFDTTAVMGRVQDIKLQTVYDFSDKGNGNMLRNVLNAAGIYNILAFYDSVKTATKCDNVQVLIFSTNRGRSYALPFAPGKDSSTRFLESAVIFNQYENGADLKTGTIIHEMLHLYGAWDIYKAFQQSGGERIPGDGIFLHSIMKDSHNQGLNNLHIDPITLWLIGWTDKYYTWFEYYLPDRFKDHNAQL